jgi:hypothetical protein
MRVIEQDLTLEIDAAEAVSAMLPTPASRREERFRPALALSETAEGAA